jgi:acyl dehydratase
MSDEAVLVEALAASARREATYRAPDALGAQSFRYFAQAVGDLNPLWLDPAAAEEAGLDGVVAPPTMVVETNAYSTKTPGPDGYIGHDWGVPTPPGWRLVRGGNHYRLRCPVGEGVVLETRWRLVDHEARRSRTGQPMVVVTGEELVVDARSGAELAVNRDRLVWLGPLPPEGVDEPGAERPAGTRTLPAELATAVRAGETDRAWRPAEGGWPALWPGAPVPPLVRKLGLPDLVAYAGATWDWHRLHYDQAWVAELGLSRPIVDGQMLAALVVEACLDWVGSSWWPSEVDLRLLAPVLAGETVAVGGKVEGSAGDRPSLRFEAWAGPGDGDEGWRQVAAVTLVLRGLSE